MEGTKQHTDIASVDLPEILRQNEYYKPKMLSFHKEPAKCNKRFKQ